MSVADWLLAGSRKLAFIPAAPSLVKYGGKQKDATSKWGLYSYVSEGDIRAAAARPTTLPREVVSPCPHAVAASKKLPLCQHLW
jgi:hypothetical protein